MNIVTHSNGTIRINGKATKLCFFNNGGRQELTRIDHFDGLPRGGKKEVLADLQHVYNTDDLSAAIAPFVRAEDIAE